MKKVKTEEKETTLEILEFEGTPVKIGKRVFVIPPLPVTFLHKVKFYNLQNELIEASNEGNLELLGDLTIKVLDIIFVAIQRNYPDIKKSETIDLITTRDLRKITPALVDIKEGIEEAKNA